MIFQDPYSSLNPRMTVLDIVGDPLHGARHRQGQGAGGSRRAPAAARVGLRPEYMRRYPHAFSGGAAPAHRHWRAPWRSIPAWSSATSRSRRWTCRCRRRFSTCLRDLQIEIGPDLHLHLARPERGRVHRRPRGRHVRGQAGGGGATEDLFHNPRHPYTEALLSAVPKPDPRLRGRGKRIILEGDVADPAHPPRGCYFHPRCRYAKDAAAPRSRSCATWAAITCRLPLRR